MIRKTIILAAAALALSVSGFAGAADAAPKSKPAAAAPAAKAPTAAEQYDLAHKNALSAFGQFKTIITTVPDITVALTQLPVEMAKLPQLEQQYVAAKNAGNEADAKKALDAYTAAVQAVVDLALPLDQGLLPLKAQLMGGFDQLGAVGAKLKAEKDVAALIADIDAALKPLDDANNLVGPLHDAAMKTTQVRIKQMAKKIFAEELANQVSNSLQAKLAQ